MALSHTLMNVAHIGATVADALCLNAYATLAAALGAPVSGDAALCRLTRTRHNGHLLNALLVGVLQHDSVLWHSERAPQVQGQPHEVGEAKLPHQSGKPD